MKRITPREAAVRKFKREYHAVECVFNHMPYPNDSSITVEPLGDNVFRCFFSDSDYLCTRK